ncbi:ABC transporter ATP-binding protein [Ktedonosporobacter rubrisoli]|uniref:ABC transporter ATP-binding protein n=1 Tax=Ktedonosporobacter rubrisoli TaxID=2509675 RepID=A0A4P6JNH1_KTERU|nr:ABC transporter ATP-binding protein [Ktedonosporobacter rubrisoli]QBD76859.1 ABC transporter ATP-binding protein [Ktedonosporobacter rubrisoli]
MSKVIEVRQLTKLYGNVQAIKEISFSLEEGKIYGLLGRNGAGKTTLMQILTAQIFASSGELKVFGEVPYENSRVLSQICFVRENQRFPEAFRVIDMLSAAASFFPNWDQEYATALCDDFQLPLKRRLKALSRGMLSTVGIIIGLASRAPLTLFDEPHLGLDAVARSIFYDRLIEDYTEHMRTIVLSTHLIDEVSQMLEHVLVIDRGRLLIDEDAETLRERAFTVAGTAGKVEAFVSGKTVVAREALGGLASVTLMGRLEARERAQAEDLGLELAPVSLQQLIIHLTGGALRRKAEEIS